MAKLSDDDHARGCQGREYTCTCGYDDRLATLLASQEAEIAELRKALLDARCTIETCLEDNEDDLAAIDAALSAR